MQERLQFGDRWVGKGEPSYLIAEVGSNFDGTLEGALRMVDRAAEVGADSAKFQSFLPAKIIARKGFEKRSSFQARWNKSVWQVYSDAAFPREWHGEVAAYCRIKGIQFSSSPYDREAVDLLMKLDVPYLKIGSGEVTNLEFLKFVAQTRKPLILGTGASTMAEVSDAVEAILSTGNDQLILLQCITNYPSTFEHANIRAMVTMGKAWGCPYGYSDHTPGSVIPVASVALGACVIEKHFTEDRGKAGPDHPFAMDLADFSEMVKSIRTLEAAMGSARKFVTDDERETVIIQRRSLFSTRAIPAGTTLTPDMIEPLRPAIGIPPQFVKTVVGMVVQRDIEAGQPVQWTDLRSAAAQGRSAR